MFRGDLPAGMGDAHVMRQMANPDPTSVDEPARPLVRARLLACPSCARHLRATERTCRFCGAPLPETFADAPVVSRPGRMGRAELSTYRARVLAASAAAVLSASCGATIGVQGADGGDTSRDAAQADDAGYADDVIFAAMYGGFPLDAGAADTGTVAEGGGYDVLVGSAYGLAAFDASFVDASSLDASSADDAASAEASASDAAPDVFFAPPYGLPAPAPDR